MQHPTGGDARCRTPWRSRRGGAALLTTLVAAMAAMTPTADAAQYTVDACQHPDGATAGHDGWVGSTTGAYVSTADQCATGGGLVATWNSAVGHANGDSAAWTFTAPPGTAIAGVTAWRSASVGTDQPYGSPVAHIVSDRATIETCTASSGCTSGSGPIGYGLDNAAWVRFGVYCAGANGCAPGGTTAITFRGVQLTLNDMSSPSFSNAPSGTLMSDSTVARTRTLSYTAQDSGGGVYRHRLLADDKELVSGIVDANGGACAAYPSSGSFSARVPCKSSASGSITLDTAALADGPHELRLEVTDATNVNRTVFGPWTVLVDNQPATVTSLTVSGTPRSGDVLTGSATTAGQAPAVTFQWLRAAADGSSPDAIPGATGATYLLTDADVGHKIMLAVTATDRGGSTTRTSSPTDAPFTGVVVAAYCQDRPTGPRDECGDFDGDGRRNRDDEDRDGDGVVNAEDADPYDAAVPPKPAPESAGSGTGTTGGGTTPGSSGGTATTGASERTGAENPPASASDVRPEAPVVNPKDPAAVPIGNPVALAGANGVPADGAAVLDVRFERAAGSVTRTTGRLVAGWDAAARVAGTITTQQGRPIAGARVFLVEKAPGAPETAWHIAGETVSGSDGGLVVRARPGGESRDLRLVYFPQGGRDGNRASNPLSLVVRQDAGLRLSRTRLHNGQTLRFRGAVRGRVPTSGAAVQLQVLLPTGWFTFRRLTATRAAGGRFTARYTFRRTTRATRYRFRVRVLPRGATPYATGYSRTLAVLVRP